MPAEFDASHLRALLAGDSVHNAADAPNSQFHRVRALSFANSVGTSIRT